MKNILLITALFISGVAMAQGRSQEAKEKKQEKTEQVKGNKPDLPASKKDEKGKSESDKSNQGNAYGRKKGEMSGREFGQARAAEAKSKEKKEKAEAIATEEEAEEMVKSTTQETKATVENIDIKLTEAKNRLEKMLEEGQISQEIFDVKMKTLETLSLREEELKKRIEE